MRRDLLADTRRLGNYPGHDRPLLAELALRGPLLCTPDLVFLNRDHAARSIRQFDPEQPLAAQIWYAPKRAGKITFPEWRVVWEFAEAIRRAPISFASKLRCARLLSGWARTRKDWLIRDLDRAARRTPLGRPTANLVRRFSFSASVGDALRALLPVGASVVVPQPYELAASEVSEFRLQALHEREGVDFGPPETESELWRDIQRNTVDAACLAVPRGSFWYFDVYSDLRSRLKAAYGPPSWSDRNVVIYELDKAQRPGAARTADIPSRTPELQERST